jgi:hypothetical protein
MGFSTAAIVVPNEEFENRFGLSWLYPPLAWEMVF